MNLNKKIKKYLLFSLFIYINFDNHSKIRIGGVVMEILDLAYFFLAPYIALGCIKYLISDSNELKFIIIASGYYKFEFILAEIFLVPISFVVYFGVLAFLIKIDPTQGELIFFSIIPYDILLFLALMKYFVGIIQVFEEERLKKPAWPVFCFLYF